MTLTSHLGHVRALEAQEYIAETLGIPQWRSYHRLAADGIRPYERDGECWYFPRDITEWLARQPEMQASALALPPFTEQEKDRELHPERYAETEMEAGG